VTDPTLGTTLTSGATLAPNASDILTTSYTVGQANASGGQTLTVSAGQTSGGLGVTLGSEIVVLSGGATSKPRFEQRWEQRR